MHDGVAANSVPVADNDFMVMAVSDGLAVIDPPVAGSRTSVTPVILLEFVIHHVLDDVLPGTATGIVSLAVPISISVVADSVCDSVFLQVVDEGQRFLLSSAGFQIKFLANVQSRFGLRVGLSEPGVVGQLLRQAVGEC